MDGLRSLLRIEDCAFGSEWVELGGPGALEVTAGEVLVGSGEDLVRAVAGDLVSVSLGAQCQLRAASGTARGQRVDIEPDFARRALELGEVSLVVGREGAAIDRRGTDRARSGARLVREIAAAEDTGTDASRLRRVALCIDLLAMLAEPRPALAAPNRLGRRGGERRERFRRALEELQRTPLDEITLPFFARRAGLSERHVSRLFQRELGVTFREHVAALRLERAKALLRETGMSVIEVAGETGWSSLAHFNAVFRRRVGATPSRFRLAADAPPRSRASAPANPARLAAR